MDKKLVHFLRHAGFKPVDDGAFQFLGVRAQLYIPHLLEIVARRPVYVRLALWFLHHPAWVKGHTGGSRLTPTVHPCPVQLGRLRVAYVVHEPNQPQEDAQPVGGSGARVQDHDPGASQPVQLSGTIGTGHGCCRTDTETVSRTATPESESSDDDESSTPSMKQSEETAPATPVSNNNKALKRC